MWVRDIGAGPNYWPAHYRDAEMASIRTAPRRWLLTEQNVRFDRPVQARG